MVEGSSFNLIYLPKKKSRPGGQLLDVCASVVANGGGDEDSINSSG
jgi:hypothetical protein